MVGLLELSLLEPIPSKVQEKTKKANRGRPLDSETSNPDDN
jgi:hypothetical protein